MAVRTVSLRPRFNWPRTLALSSTFVLHLAAIAVVAIPIAAPLVKPMPQIVPAVVFETKEPEKVVPEPPPPMPLPRVKRVQKPDVVATPVPVPTPVSVNTVPIESPMSTPAVAQSPASLPIAGGGDAPAGETRTLAYDGALKLRYPQASMRQREQGTVLLRVLVDTAGSVQRIEVERSSGHSQLDAAAREAVQRAHFRPVLRDGQAVQAWGIVPIEFRLDRT
jgi:protein TonB